MKARLPQNCGDTEIAMKAYRLGQRLIGLVGMVACLTATAERTELKAGISAVTVFPGVARVTRKAEVAVTPGSISCVIRELPVWVDHAGIQAHVGPADNVRLLGVRTESASKPGFTKDELKAEEDKLAKLEQELADAKATIAAQLEAIDSERAYLDSLMPWYKDRLPEESKARPITAAEIKEVNDYLSQARLELVKKKAELGQGTREIDEAIAKQKKALEELRKKPASDTVELLIDLAVTSAGTAQLQVSYIIAGAAWFPEHAVSLDGAPGTATAQTQAVVYQATGEPWPAVPMTFSTSHPFLGSAVPSLGEWSIGVVKKGKGTPPVQLPHAARLDRAFGSRLDALMKRWREGVGHDDAGKEAVARVLAGQAQAATLMRQLSIRGISPEYVAQGTPVCASDGRAAVAVLAQSELPCAAQVRLVPALSSAGFETLNLTNTGDQALLPGSVAVFRSGHLTGRSAMPFTGPGEDASVPVGRTESVTAVRRLDLSATSTTVLGPRARQTIAYTITVKNASESDVQAEVIDQLPVSKSKDVTIRLAQSEPRAETGAQGTVRWAFTLKPGATRELAYRLETECPVGKLPSELAMLVPRRRAK